MTDKLGGPPMLFPCASRVLVPHVGADEREYAIRSSPQLNSQDSPLARGQGLVYNSNQKDSSDLNAHYLKKISTGLSFSEDVVQDRCFHALPYDGKYLQDALKLPNFLKTPKKTSQVMGRFYLRGSDKKHQPCHLKSTGPHYLKPLKRRIMKKALEMAKQEEDLLQQDQQEEESPFNDMMDGRRSVTSPSGVFLTEALPSHTTKSKLKSSKTLATEGKSKETGQVEDDEEYDDEGKVAGKFSKKLKSDWDSHLINMLSKRTARWIVHQKMLPDDHQQDLEDILAAKYGKPSTTELVPDDMSETSFTMFKKREAETPKKKYRRQEEILLERATQTPGFDDSDDESVDLTTVPYADRNKATFYRQPAGLRRERKHQARAQAAFNRTAGNIEVIPRKSLPPPTLNDFMNPHCGDKMFSTDNMFQQEWLTGTKQVHQEFGDKSKIVLENLNRYRKVLQRKFPDDPESWFPETDEEKQKRLKDAKKSKKISKGLHRWKDLPEPIDDTAELLNLKQPGTDLEDNLPDPTKLRKIKKGNLSLLRIVDDWKHRWNLNDRYADSTPDDLIVDMQDLHPHVRLKAITTIAKAAEYRPPPEPGIQIHSHVEEEDHVSTLPEKLFVALECLLRDTNHHVRRAAAITLFSLNRPHPEGEKILRETLRNEKSIDRWAAALCLSHFGVCDSEVVGELVHQLMTQEDLINHERCAHLLSKLSVNSTLPYSMLAEQLNSSSWRHRVMACKVMVKLHGKINRDIAQKLTNLMWNDWHSEVRKAAAQTLGKSGHGKDIHDQLRERLNSSDANVRVDAIVKVGYLKIMTSKLLPSFLKCFDDDYIAAKISACQAAGMLQIEEPDVIDKLVYLATYERVWKIKAHAIKAMGRIGKETEAVRDCVIWAFRFEDQAGVRAEACHTIVALKMDDEEVTQILQDKFLVEPDQMVKKQIAQALAKFGISATEETDMVIQIKNEVRKLCTKSNICAQITVNESIDDKEYNLARMLYRPGPAEDLALEQKMRSVTNTPAPPEVKVTSRTPSPSVREQNLFTPTADDELERILEQVEEEDEEEDDEDERNTVKTGTEDLPQSVTSKPRSKPGSLVSQALSAVSGDEDEDEDDGDTSEDGEDDWGEEKEDDGDDYDDDEEEGRDYPGSHASGTSRGPSRMSNATRGGNKSKMEDLEEIAKTPILRRIEAAVEGRSSSSRSKRSTRSSVKSQSRKSSAKSKSSRKGSIKYQSAEKELSDRMEYMEVTSETDGAGASEGDQGTVMESDIITGTQKSMSSIQGDNRLQDFADDDTFNREQDSQMILDILRKRYPDTTPTVSESPSVASAYQRWDEEFPVEKTINASPSLAPAILIQAASSEHIYDFSDQGSVLEENIHEENALDEPSGHEIMDDHDENVHETTLDEASELISHETNQQNDIVQDTSDLPLVLTNQEDAKSEADSHSFSIHTEDCKSQPEST